METRNGRQRRKLSEIFNEDGRAHLNLEAGDLLVALHVPLIDNVRCGYFKSRVRQTTDFPLAGVAAALTRDGDVISSLAIALTGTNSRPLLLDSLDELLGGPLTPELLKALGKKIAHSIQPMRTTLVSLNYRRHVVDVLAKRLVTQLYEGGDCDQRRSIHNGGSK